MNFSQILTKFRRKKGAGPFPRFSRDDILVWGTFICIILFIGFLALDGYIFYTIRFQENSIPEPGASKRMLSEQDINTTIQVMEERAKKLDELSHPPAITKSTSTVSAPLKINLLLPGK